MIRRAALSAVLAPLSLSGGALAQDSLAPPVRENYCLTCPRPVPACWMTLYRWQDYNLKGGMGTTVIVTTGTPPSEADKETARQRILAAMEPKSEVAMGQSSRIACPDDAQVE